MKTGSSYLLLACLFAALSLARKTFLVKEQHPAVLAPRVQGYDSSWVIFNVNNYNMVLDNQIQLDLGWDFTQRQGYYGSYSFRQWAFRNNIYMISDFVLHPELQLSSYYMSETFTEIPKFRLNLFWELIWFPVQDDICLQVGWNADPIALLLRTDFNVLECSKVLIKTFTQWDQWNWAKIQKGQIFDACTSSISSNIQLFKWDIYVPNAASPDNTWTPKLLFDTATTPELLPASRTFCFWLPYFVK
jgi:hypothetical protein